MNDLSEFEAAPVLQKPTLKRRYEKLESSGEESSSDSSDSESEKYESKKKKRKLEPSPVKVIEENSRPNQNLNNLPLSKTDLFISGINLDFTQEKLKEYLKNSSNEKELNFIELKQDYRTKKFFGKAIVSFHKKENARNLFTYLSDPNNTKNLGTNVKIAYCNISKQKKENQIQENEKLSVVLGNLPEYLKTSKKIKEFLLENFKFSDLILGIEWINNKSFAKIDLGNTEDAKLLAKQNGFSIGQKRMTVAYNISNKNSKNQQKKKKNYTSIFVGNLSHLTTEETLKKLFAPFGKIVDVRLKENNCGFVDFYNGKFDRAEILDLHEMMINGRRIRVEECNQRTVGTQRKGGSAACFNCGKEGHLSIQCPDERLAPSEKLQNTACFKCGQKGHISKDCPNSDQKLFCFNCGDESHTSKNCPMEKNFGIKKCFNCGEEGHISSKCPNKHNIKK